MTHLYGATGKLRLSRSRIKEDNPWLSQVSVITIKAARLCMDYNFILYAVYIHALVRTETILYVVYIHALVKSMTILYTVYNNIHAMVRTMTILYVVYNYINMPWSG